MKRILNAQNEKYSFVDIHQIARMSTANENTSVFQKLTNIMQYDEVFFSGNSSKKYFTKMQWILSSLKGVGCM